MTVADLWNLLLVAAAAEVVLGLLTVAVVSSYIAMRNKHAVKFAADLAAIERGQRSHPIGRKT